MIDNNPDPKPTRISLNRTGRNASPVPVRKNMTSHLLQTGKKKDYRMVDAIPPINKAGVESSK